MRGSVDSYLEERLYSIIAEMEIEGYRWQDLERPTLNDIFYIYMMLVLTSHSEIKVKINFLQFLIQNKYRIKYSFHCQNIVNKWQVIKLITENSIALDIILQK